MGTLKMLGGLHWLVRLLLWGLLVGGCGGLIGVARTGGESHFLRTCEVACGQGLDCISGVCTRGCLVGQSSCTDLDPNALCTDESIEPGAVAVCDVSCTSHADCASLGTSHRCEQGYCRGAVVSASELPDGVGGGSGGLAGVGGIGGESVGGAAGAGGSPESDGASGSPALVPTALTMDDTCYVSLESNDFGIHGPWHLFSDQEGDGRTVITSPVGGTCSYVEGQGMCMRADSPGGADDNYATWGAGIGLYLSQVPGSKASTLSPAPRCFTVVLRIQSTFSDGFTGELLPTPPEDNPGALYPVRILREGANEVCVDNVTRPDYCPSPEECVDPADLANGIAAINIVAHAGATGGSVDFCIESITPHD